MEAAQVRKENRIAVIKRRRRYADQKRAFIASMPTEPMVSVFDGKVKVLARRSQRRIRQRQGTRAADADTKPRKFDRDQTDDLYAWSKLRSGYMAEANEAGADRSRRRSETGMATAGIGARGIAPGRSFRGTAT